jgi:hypothetical protein
MLKRRWTVGLLAAIAALGALALVPMVGAQEGGAMPPPPKEAQKIQKSIDTYKAKLVKDERYGCCVAPTCDMCATKMGGCPCGKMAAAGKPVCRECKGGWEAGEGVIPGKKASDIKAMPMMKPKQ